MKVLTENIEELCDSKEQERYLNILIENLAVMLDSVKLRLYRDHNSFVLHFSELCGLDICSYSINVIEMTVVKWFSYGGIKVKAEEIASTVKKAYLEQYGIIYR